MGPKNLVVLFFWSDSFPFPGNGIDSQRLQAQYDLEIAEPNIRERIKAIKP
jgi:hypothetical protein